MMIFMLGVMRFSKETSIFYCDDSPSQLSTYATIIINVTSRYSSSSSDSRIEVYVGVLLNDYVNEMLLSYLLYPYLHVFDAGAFSH